MSRIKQMFARKSKLKFSAGFTLLEILVATIILAFVLTGLANVFIVGKSYTLHVRSKIGAAEIGKYFLEPLYLQVRQDQWGSKCVSQNGINPADCLTNQAWLDPITNITYTATYNNSAWTIGGVNLRKVKVTINWSETAF